MNPWSMPGGAGECADPEPNPARRSLLALAALLPLADLARADAYPSKPIRLIVPFAPGGGNDSIARLIASTIDRPLGQPVVVENKPGAGGSLGASLAAHAAADGYTLFLGGVGSHALNPVVNPAVGYDPVRDFAPIAWIASAPMVLVVHPAVPATSVKAFIAHAKAHPGALNYASNGNGSSSQLAGVIFNQMAGTEMTHVPYKGLAPAVTDLLAGQVQVMWSSVVAILPLVQSGKLRALGTTGLERLASLPSVPTISESGLDGYETSSWYGILAPAGTPVGIVNRLNAEINQAVNSEAIRAQLTTDGAIPAGGPPARFADHIRSELDRMRRYAKDIRLN